MISIWPGKKVVFTLITIVVVLVTCEIMGHVIYVASRGRYVWQREEFRVGGYTQRVDDERYVTGKPYYRNTQYKDNQEAPWDVELDSHGFRTVSKPAREDGPSIAFIGDSVPFGYHVNSQDSVPSLLQDILREQRDPRHVINAALPAYSLDQAVHRYKYELAGRYDIEVLILQIYDPASQFVILGREWDVTKNWTTFKDRKELFPALRFSALRTLFYFLYDALAFRTDRFDGNDEQAIRTYVASIRKSLQLLRADTEGHVKKLIILPTTLPPKTWAEISRPHKVALTVQNSTLQKFSEQHPGIEFIDTNEFFVSDTEGRGFIDECCHLSREGASREAHLLARHLPPS